MVHHHWYVVVVEDDFLDGCDVDFTVEPDDDETASLRPLFPDGVPSDKWVGLFE